MTADEKYYSLLWKNISLGFYSKASWDTDLGAREHLEEY